MGLHCLAKMLLIVKISTPLNETMIVLQYSNSKFSDPDVYGLGSSLNFGSLKSKMRIIFHGSEQFSRYLSFENDNITVTVTSHKYSRHYSHRLTIYLNLRSEKYKRF